MGTARAGFVTVTRVYDEERVARDEVTRLSALRDPREIEYFVLPAELHTTAPGDSPVVLTSVEGYVEGTRVKPSQVRLHGVWASAEAALESIIRQTRHGG